MPQLLLVLVLQLDPLYPYTPTTMISRSSVGGLGLMNSVVLFSYTLCNQAALL